MSRPARTALVIGAAGQDGSYLCEHLLTHGYQVFGLVREGRPVRHLPVSEHLEAVTGDINNTSLVADLIAGTRPQEIYNLAAVTYGPDVWDRPVDAARTGTSAVAGLLDAVLRLSPGSRFFQASSAWVFGSPSLCPQDESTPYAPMEPYGAAKAYGDQLVRAYRTRFDLFACSGILFNHESPRRGEQFVSRKITKAVAAIKTGSQTHVTLSGLDGVRDWGFAGDYVMAAWLMLQSGTPADYVIATGVPHTVQELVSTAFSCADLEWTAHVRLNPELMRSVPRPSLLIGDSSAARSTLGWAPAVTFEELVERMVRHDLSELADSSG